MAVIFAMLASYFLSRTLVPTMVRYMLSNEIHIYQATAKGEHVEGGIFWKIHNRLMYRLKNSGLPTKVFWNLI